MMMHMAYPTQSHGKHGIDPRGLETWRRGGEHTGFL